MAELRHARPTGISVVIPHHDRPGLLRRAVDSVCAGAAERAEIIVVDDASPADPCTELPARNAAGIPVRCVRQARNRGPQAARNLGIRRARFSHVALLDSDDEFLPAKLDHLLALVDREDPDFVFHAVLGMERYARIADIWWRQGRPWLGLPWLLALLNPAPTPGVLLRRGLGLGPPGLRHAEDWAFLLHVVGPGTRVRWLAEPLARVHRAPGSLGGLSAARAAMRRGEFQARRLLCRQSGPGPRVRWLLGTLAGLARMAADRLRGRWSN